MRTNAATVPLTLGQRLRLAVRCVPPFFFLLATGAASLVARHFDRPPAAALLVVTGAVIVLTGVPAWRGARDLRSGVALVAEDVLERSGSTGGYRGRLYGRFAELGSLWLCSRAYVHGRPGSLHRLTYSAASRIVWSLEPRPKG